MIYLDTAATTEVLEEVLNTYILATRKYIGNYNSIHHLGSKAKETIKLCNQKIGSLLNVKENELIYTSSASESNNTILKGLSSSYPKRVKHIVTTKLEHSSILKTCLYLEDNGFKISYVKLTDDKTVDLIDLKRLLDEGVLLVFINAVDSQAGIIQPLEKIASLVKLYPTTFFATDATSLIGKKHIDLTNIDFMSMAGHKINAVKGISVLYKKEHINLTPLIHGGNADTIYRSSTPNLPAIVALTKAFDIAYSNMQSSYEQLQELHDYLYNKLKDIPKIILNSPSNSIASIINFSILNIKPSTLINAFNKYEIYISSVSACDEKNEISVPIYELYKDLKRASHTIRISLHNNLTYQDLDYFVTILKKLIKELGE